MRRLRSWTVAVVGILVFVTFAFSCGRVDAGPESSIKASDLAARIASGTAPVILDVRTPDEFASGHISGAVNVPLNELADRLPGLELSPTQEIVVHCQRGPRAAKAETILRNSGYTNVRDLTGHMAEWRTGSYPLE